MSVEKDEQAENTSITGRCYCGAIEVIAKALPQAVTYCHCADCKRVTGSPLPAFAAFSHDQVSLTPCPTPVSHFSGVTRWFCPDCGSPLLASFDYLPDQRYVPVGIMSDLDALPPALHCHASSKAAWLHIDDNLPQEAQSGRGQLNANSQ